MRTFRRWSKGAATLAVLLCLLGVSSGTRQDRRSERADALAKKPQALVKPSEELHAARGRQPLPVHLDAQGDFVLVTEAGELRLHQPRVYQAIDGVKHAILAHYVLLPLPPGIPSPSRRTFTHIFSFAGRG